MTDQQSNAYYTFHRFQQSREKYYAPKFYQALKNQFKEFISAYKKGNKDALMVVHSYAITRIIKDLYKDAGITYGAKIRASLPKKPKTQKAMVIGFNERMVNLINAYFETDILNTSEGITDTTRGIIQDILTEANEGGFGIDWIEEHLFNEAAELQTRNRSRLIARTETVTGTNLGGYLGAMDAGLMMTKEWLATGDHRTRPDHVAVSGRTIGMLDYFTVGTSTLLFPGDRKQENGLPVPVGEIANCRCTCLYEAVRIDGRLVEFDYTQFAQLIAA